MKRSTLSVMVLLLAIMVPLFVVSCGGGGGGGSAPSPTPKVQLSGTIGSGYTTASVKPQSFFARLFTFVEKAYAGVGIKVNKVIAVPITGGTASAGMMSLSQSTTPDLTGKFSLSLDKSYDWMLVLLDTTATATVDRFVGYVDLSPNLAVSNSLLMLPMTGATIASHDLGNIVNTGPTGSVTNSISALSFSLTTTQLTTMAKSDDMLRFAKNMVMNYDPATGIYYNLRPNFQLRGNFLATLNSYPTVTAGTYVLNSYTLQLDSNMPKTTLSMDMVTGPVGTRTSVELFPPQTISSYGTTTPLTNMTTGMTCGFKNEDGVDIKYCSDDDMSITDYSDISYWFGLNDVLKGAVPTGQWLYKVGGQTKAEFDIAAANPVSGSGVLKVPIPVFKANVVSDVLQSIDVKWYIANDAGTGYDVLSDTSIFGKIMANCDWAIEGNKVGGAPGEFARETGLFNPVSQTSITPVSTWYFASTDITQQYIKAMQIHCDSGGVGFFFQNQK